MRRLEEKLLIDDLYNEGEELVSMETISLVRTVRNELKIASKY